jgi:uncharacterized membrane protein
MGSRWDTGRIEAFSDGVFAFAITLLVLDIQVPESGFNHLWASIAHQWPSYLGYVTSFLTVGGIWMVHHGMFLRLKDANRQVTTLNLLLLMAIAFLPFPTRLVAEAIRNPHAERAAVIFYGAWLLVIALLLKTLWGLGHERAQRAQIRGERRGGRRDHAGDDAQPRLLWRRDRARASCPVRSRVRIPGDRDRRRSASRWRQRADTPGARVCVTPRGDVPDDQSTGATGCLTAGSTRPRRPGP